MQKDNYIGNILIDLTDCSFSDLLQKILTMHIQADHWMMRLSIKIALVYKLIVLLE